MKKYFEIFQILVSLFLILFIILQQRGGASSVIFGLSSYGVRRGVEKKIFYLTIFLGVLFVLLALLNAFLK